MLRECVRIRLSGGIAAAAILALSTVPAAAADKPLRQLVYSFSVGISNASRDASSASGMSEALQAGARPGAANQTSTSGANAYTANTSDKGDIALEIIGMRPDGGLVVTANERAKSRNALNVTCVVYASTNVVCGDGTPNAEIVAVLRTLSPNFFDGVPLDENDHWQVSRPKDLLTIDFTARSAANGLVTISSQRDQTFKGAASGSIHATASYAYDPKKYIANSLKEYTIVREETGPGSYNNITIDITAQLTSDSGTPH